MTDELTVGQVATRFGVTVRTLHHYDAIGLVQPSERGRNGYRLYTPADVQSLARVVLLRRLEMPLADIAEALDEPAVLAARLAERREAVMARRIELDALVDAIDTALTSEATMSEYQIGSAEMKEIFGSGYDEAYDVEAQQRWGGTEEFAESRRRAKSYDKATWQRIKAESDEVLEQFATAMRDGVAPGSAQAGAAVQAHRDQIERWFNPVPLPMLRGMGTMYSTDPRFAKTYDDVEPGLAEYVTEVVVAYCDGASS